jgi:hypothetical protein
MRGGPGPHESMVVRCPCSFAAIRARQLKAGATAGGLRFQQGPNGCIELRWMARRGFKA